MTDDEKNEEEVSDTEVSGTVTEDAPEAETPEPGSSETNQVPEVDAAPPVAETPEPGSSETNQVLEVDAAPKKQRSRRHVPRSERRQRPKPVREKPKTRKPIVRTPKPEAERGRRQERRGVVVSDKGDKTIVVKVDVTRIHPTYKKVVRRSVKFHAHDERNAAGVGDTVRIVETRPLSRTKRWRLAEIVEKAR